MWLRSDLFKIYQIYLSFDLGHIAVFSFRSIHKLPGLVICLISCKLLIYQDKLCKADLIGYKLSFVQIHTFVGLYIVIWHVALDLAVLLHIGIGSFCRFPVDHYHYTLFIPDLLSFSVSAELCQYAV